MVIGFLNVKLIYHDLVGLFSGEESIDDTIANPPASDQNVQK